MFQPNGESIEYVYRELYKCGLYGYYFVESTDIALSKEQETSIIKIVEYFTKEQHNIHNSIKILENIISIIYNEEKQITELRQALRIPEDNSDATALPKIKFTIQIPELDKLNELALIKSYLDSKGHTDKYGQSKFYEYDLAESYYYYFALKAITQE